MFGSKINILNLNLIGPFRQVWGGGGVVKTPPFGSGIFIIFK